MASRQRGSGSLASANPCGWVSCRVAARLTLAGAGQPPNSLPDRYVEQHEPAFDRFEEEAAEDQERSEHTEAAHGKAVGPALDDGDDQAHQRADCANRDPDADAKDDRGPAQ